MPSAEGELSRTPGPCVPSPVPTSPRSSHAEPAGGGSWESSLRILVCDSHALFSSSLALALDSRGHEVRVASAPARAMQVLAAQSVDVCLLELAMLLSRRTGPSATAMMRALAPEARMLLLVDDDVVPRVPPALASRVEGSISKSWSLEGVMATLHELTRPRAPAADELRVPR